MNKVGIVGVYQTKYEGDMGEPVRSLVYRSTKEILSHAEAMEKKRPA